MNIQLSKLLLWISCVLRFCFLEKEKLFTLLQFHIGKNGTKGVMQALQQKGRWVTAVLGHSGSVGQLWAGHSFRRQ